MKGANEPGNITGHRRIQFFKSPVTIETHEGLSSNGYRAKDEPEFDHEEDAKDLELFYDLFFAANYTVLSEIHGIRSVETLKSYIGYYSILWLTWCLVTLYDVRYLTDCVFERVMRAVHLGVMVGFAVVTPNYDPEEQSFPVFRSMSIMLFISRIGLCAEYAYPLWCVRKYNSARRSMFVQIGVHMVAAFIYLGVTFSFDESKKHSRGFIAWYVVSAAEGLVTLAISNWWEALSLTDTHLMKRMGLLTLVILGDGVIILAQEVSTIVEAQTGRGHPWNALTIGVVTAAAMCIYFVFLIYSDWKTREHLEDAWRQQLWAILHFPVHLALTLFIQGFVQFVLWGKIFDIVRHARVYYITSDPVALATATSLEVARNLSAETVNFFNDYEPEYQFTVNKFNESIRKISQLPDSTWPRLSRSWNATAKEFDVPNQAPFNTLSGILYDLFDSVLAALFSAYSVDITKDLDKDLQDEPPTKPRFDFQDEDVIKTLDKYAIIFQYAYIAAACALASMTLLTVVSHTSRWRAWPITRVVFCLLLSLPVGLLALLDHSYSAIEHFLLSAWPLPTLTLVWFTVLLVTYAGNGLAHLRHDKGGSHSGHSKSPA